MLAFNQHHHAPVGTVDGNREQALHNKAVIYEAGVAVNSNKAMAYQERASIEENRALVLKVGMGNMGGIFVVFGLFVFDLLGLVVGFCWGVFLRCVGEQELFFGGCFFSHNR